MKQTKKQTKKQQLVLRHEFGFTKLRKRSLKKNTAQIVTLFALSKLWMAPAAANLSASSSLLLPSKEG